jgi:hypothetical protein
MFIISLSKYGRNCNCNFVKLTVGLRNQDRYVETVERVRFKLLKVFSRQLSPCIDSLRRCILTKCNVTS